MYSLKDAGSAWHCFATADHRMAVSGAEAFPLAAHTIHESIRDPMAGVITDNFIIFLGGNNEWMSEFQNQQLKLREERSMSQAVNGSSQRKVQSHGSTPKPISRC
jgi:hypothetical protein